MGFFLRRPALLVLLLLGAVGSGALFYYVVVPTPSERRQANAKIALESMGCKVSILNREASLIVNPEVTDLDMASLVKHAVEFDRVDFDIGAAKLLRSDFRQLASIARLRSVSLAGMLVKVDDLRCFAELSGLSHLNLSNTGIGDDAFEVVSTFHSLKQLNLGRNPAIRGNGIAAVLALEALTDLTLSGTHIEDAALNTVVKLKSLETLYIQDVPTVSDDNVAAIREAYPELVIRRRRMP